MTVNINLWQPQLDPQYTHASDEELKQRIASRKAELGSDLVILGHHYQADEVIDFADFTGDSFKLSQLAAEKVKAVDGKYVVFAGVHFMAESADILTPEATAVILPDLGAGCSMADMANHDQTVEAWEQLGEALAGTKSRVIPICYMNSSAAIKAFCGEHGGAVCTSSNAVAVIQWALAGGTEPVQDDKDIKILFLPDQHLGRNTAGQLGFDVTTQTAVWDPRHPEGFGGLDESTIQDVTFLLWKGHCSVHKLFRPEHVDQIRAEWPDVNVMVHPECAYEVCQKADQVGSTEGILQAVAKAEPGSRWAIGTEVHMVNRLANQAKERGVIVRMLSECQCLCTTMFRIDLPHLAWVLDRLAEGEVVNQISVHPTVQHWSMIALDRMLSITGNASAAQTPSESSAATA